MNDRLKKKKMYINEVWICFSKSELKEMEYTEKKFAESVNFFWKQKIFWNFMNLPLKWESLSSAYESYW